MKFVISPAKSLNLESPVPTEKFTKRTPTNTETRLNNFLALSGRSTEDLT